MKELSISVKKLNNMILDREKFYLIDVREKDEYNIAKVTGSVLIPILDIREKLIRFKLTDVIVLYCHTGNRSLEVAIHLAWLGFINVVDLDGGIDTWSNQIDSKIPRYTRNPKKTKKLLELF